MVAYSGLLLCLLQDQLWILGRQRSWYNYLVCSQHRKVTHRGFFYMEMNFGSRYQFWAVFLCVAQLSESPWPQSHPALLARNKTVALWTGSQCLILNWNAATHLLSLINLYFYKAGMFHHGIVNVQWLPWFALVGVCLPLLTGLQPVSQQQSFGNDCLSLW